jgi:HemY protein
MRSALAYLALLALGVGGVMALARLGGAVEIRVGEVEIAAPFAVALLLLALLFLTLHLILAGIGALRRWPAARRARREARQRGEGEAALTRALVALAAGTPDQARLQARRARDKLGDTPQLLILTAEAERLAGRDEAASEAFHALAAREDAKFLGLRGLLRQAIQREDWPTAQRLAREAEAAQPGAAWLRQERETLALRTRDWREALALAAPGGAQAPLALAAAGQETDERRAIDLEREAYQADRGFTPAALAHAARLSRIASPRRGREVLQEAWKAKPHPDLAVAYLEGEADPLQQVKAAEKLVVGQPQHAESRLLIGRLAAAAGLTGRARQELDALVASGAADRRAYLALSDLEEVEGGDTPESRAAQAKWLRLAATAAPEPRWRCSSCGAEHEGWEAVCPGCGSVGTIAWTSPQQTTLLPR